MDRLELEEVGKMISLCRDRVCAEGIGVPIEWPGSIEEEVIARWDGVGVVVEGVGVAVEGEGVVEGLQVVVEEVIFGVSVVSVTGGVVGVDVWNVGVELAQCTEFWPHETTFKGNRPLFTLMSVAGNMVGPEAFIPKGLLPFARALAFVKHQFWDPGFHM